MSSAKSASAKGRSETTLRRSFGARVGSGFRKLWFGSKPNPSRSKVVRCRYFGARLIVNLEDEVGHDIALRRYDWHELTQMIEACRRIQPELFIDVGANLGLYSCVLGHNDVVPRILALEPDRANFARLTANLTLNNLTDRAEVRAAGAAAHSGTATLLPASATDRGGSRIETAAKDGAEGGYAVEMVALDDVARLDDTKIAAKIDTQGSEIEALMGAAQLFTRNCGYAQIEARSNQAAGVITELMAAFSWRRIGQHGSALRFEKP